MYTIRARYLAICGAALLCAASAPPQASAQTSDSLLKTQAFAPGQTVRVDINVGDLHILPSPDDHQIRLEIQPKHGASSAEMQSWIRQFDVTGNQANVRLHMPKHGDRSGQVTLYVPSTTALNVDLGVGDVVLDGISGDKDLSIDVGDLKIGGLNPSEYGIVKNGTGIGDVEDKVFSAQQSGWLGKSEKVTGSGKYHIRARVGVGDIRLQKGTLGGAD